MRTRRMLVVFSALIFSSALSNSPAWATRTIRADIGGSDITIHGEGWGDIAYFPTSSSGWVAAMQFDYLNIGHGAQFYTVCFSQFGFASIFPGNVGGYNADQVFECPGDGNNPDPDNVLMPMPISVASPDNSTKFGFVDPVGYGENDPPDNPNYTAPGLPASAFTWSVHEDDFEGGFPISQIVFVLQGNNGDFDLEFNYSDPPAGTTQELHIGDNVASGPVILDHLYNPFCFRSGKLVDCTTALATPEPLSLALFGAGLASMGAVRRKVTKSFA